jgi:3-phosphoshikimate 1-carboxyvinyltransferase
MTRRIMETFGARPARLWSDRAGPLERATYLVRSSGYQARDYAIEADAMSASYLFAAAAVTGGSVTVRGLRRASMQGDITLLDAFQKMGCSISESPEGLRCEGGSLRGTSFNLSQLPDMAPTLAVVACFATGPTTMTGIRRLRLKESDRIAALDAELTRLGARIEAGEDTMTIHPPASVQPATIQTYDDHRIAMAFAVAGLVVDGIEIRDPSCVDKTFPGFFDVLGELG